MKMKTLATLAASGLLAVSLAHITPVFAEDNFDDGMGGQQLALADNSNTAAIPGEAMNANEDNNNNYQQLAQGEQQAAQQAPQQAAQPQRIDTASNSSAAPQSPAATVNPAGQQQAANPTSTDQPIPDVASGDEDF